MSSKNTALKAKENVSTATKSIGSQVYEDTVITKSVETETEVSLKCDQPRDDFIELDSPESLYWQAVVGGLKKELKEIREAKEDAKDEIYQLRNSLEENITRRDELLLKIEELEATKDKS